MQWKYWSFFAVIVATILKSLWNKYWVYLPATMNYFKNPVGPYKEMVWQRNPSNRSKGEVKENPPNIILIGELLEYCIPACLIINSCVLMSVVVDDMGFNDITFYGGGYHNGAIKTPHIDSIGHNGVSFRNAYAGHATCAPSRAALLTGILGPKLGYEFTPVSRAGSKVLGGFGIELHPGIYHADKAVGVGYANMTLPLDAVTLAQAMKSITQDNGRIQGTANTNYHTIQIGKWHLGTTPESSPVARGFDEALGVPLLSLYLPVHHPDSINCYLSDPLDNFLWANMRYEIKINNATSFTEPKGYFTDYLANEAVKAIDSHQDDPFFMYLAFTAIHSPLQALKSDYDSLVKYTDLSHCDKVYAAMLLSLDRAVGKVLAALKKNGLNENTMVIFTSDNGGPGYIDQRTINAPYRGWKASFFEGGIRVPLFMQYPKVIQPHTVINDRLVSHVDIFPTVLEAASMQATNYSVDGISLWKDIILQQSFDQKSKLQSQKHDEIVDDSVGGVRGSDADTGGHNTTIRMQNRSLFFRSGHYKTVIYRGFEAGRAFQSTDTSVHNSLSASIPIWKYQTSENPLKSWLFDLLNDPTEQTNLLTASLDSGNESNCSVEHIRDVQVFMELLLREENDKQAEHPIWECVSESPVLIDKISSDSVVEGDEYIYWPN